MKTKVERVEVDNSRLEPIQTHTNQPQAGQRAMAPRTKVLLGWYLVNGALGRHTRRYL